MKLADGSEFEAEGAPEFVQSERSVFLSAHDGPSRTQAAAKPADWASIVESRDNALQLKAKLKSDKNQKDACLVLLAAAQRLLNLSKPTAAQLARWLRASGYPVGRIDRALSEALDRGELLASGSRRARRYQLTGPGLLKATLLAEQLQALVAGA